MLGRTTTRPAADTCRHAASADFPLDGVAVGEGSFETVEEIWHCVLAPVATVLEYGLGRQAARR